jgi:hypothetical protein
MQGAALPVGRHSDPPLAPEPRALKVGVSGSYGSNGANGDERAERGGEVVGLV